MTQEMTGKQRLTAAMRGEPVDRVPVWLREGFPIVEPFPEADHFTLGWQTQQLYSDLLRDISPYADGIRTWSLGLFFNRFLMVPPDRIHTEESMVTADTKRIDGVVDTPRGELTFSNEVRRGSRTVWYVKALVESVGDLEKLAEVGFELDPADIQGFFSEDRAARGQAGQPDELRAGLYYEEGNYHRLLGDAGDRGILRLELSSPIVSISGCMSFELFLEMSVTQKALFHELLEEVTRRNLLLIDAMFEGRALDAIVNLGGSEQCTPPMMDAWAFDEFVVPYDGQIVGRLKEYGVMAHCHCHGKIRHALARIIDMGFDATDPVEPPPAGDVTYAEARAIAGGRITLVGNLEWDELCFAEPWHIRQRVKEILEPGGDRLILAASAGPISAITPRLADNYRAWVETALEYG